MVLYVDETETDDFFIVSGMLAESKEAVLFFEKALRLIKSVFGRSIRAALLNLFLRLGYRK